MPAGPSALSGLLKPLQCGAVNFICSGNARDSRYGRATLNQSSLDQQDVFGREAQRLDTHLLKIVLAPVSLHQSAIGMPSEALQHVHQLVGQNMAENRSAKI